MAIRQILKMGHPFLRKPTALVSPLELGGQALQSTIDDMFDTMESKRGIGIAAPQIGVGKQLAIIDAPDEDHARYPKTGTAQQEGQPSVSFPLVVINPMITVIDQRTEGYWEGCLSVPTLRGYVERPKEIAVKFLDLQGIQQEIVVKGFMATVFQHELDHLKGILFVDCIVDKSKLAFIEEYKKYHRTD